MTTTGSRSWAWLAGLAVNLVLALVYLLVAPVSEQPHRDLAILVGSYFATFVLADVTTTNALGQDADRVSRRLSSGTPLSHILLRKNLVLMLVVGLPVLAATAVVTLQHEPAARLALTLPAVLGPTLVWFGLGNLVSVLLPVSRLSVRQRWQQRRDLRSTGRWLVTIGLPYALCSLMDPASRLPVLALRALGVTPGGSLLVPAVVLAACGVLAYAALTAVALGVAQRRSLVFHDLPACAPAPVRVPLPAPADLGEQVLAA